MPRATKQPPLTDAQWAEVFRIKCLSKEGRPLSKEERALSDRAFDENAERYGAMEPDVFNATVPFGSTRRLPTSKKDWRIGRLWK